MQYQYQYQYLERSFCNTNINTNTWKGNFAISIPIPIPRSIILQYQYQYQYPGKSFCNTNSNTNIREGYFAISISGSIPILLKNFDINTNIWFNTDIIAQPWFLGSQMVTLDMSEALVPASLVKWVRDLHGHVRLFPLTKMPEKCHENATKSKCPTGQFKTFPSGGKNL